MHTHAGELLAEALASVPEKENVAAMGWGDCAWRLGVYAPFSGHLFHLILFLFIYIDLCAIKNYINRNRGASGMAAWVLVFVCISTSPSL